MPDQCCIANCKNIRKKGGSISFYRFPSDYDEKSNAIRIKWVSVLGLEDWSEERIDNSRVCSSHFISGESSMLSVIDFNIIMQQYN